MGRLGDTALVGGEQKDAVEHLVAGIARLGSEVHDASSYLPAYDQRTYAEVYKPSEGVRRFQSPTADLCLPLRRSRASARNSTRLAQASLLAHASPSKVAPARTLPPFPYPMQQKLPPRNGVSSTHFRPHLPNHLSYTLRPTFNLPTETPPLLHSSCRPLLP